MTELPFVEVELTEVFTEEVPGRVNIRAGGTYCVLVGALLSLEAKEYLINLATPLLAMMERENYGNTDLEMFGLAVANRLRQAGDEYALEILTALERHDRKTWFTRVPKP